MKLRITVNTIEIIILVTIGKINTKLSFLMIISPGSLKTCILGKTKNRNPRIIKITPKMMKNFAKLLITSLCSAKS